MSIPGGVGIAKGVSVAVGEIVGVGVQVFVGVGVKLGVAEGDGVAGRGVCVGSTGIAATVLIADLDSDVGVTTGEAAVQPTKARAIPIAHIFTRNEKFPFFIFTSFGYQRPIAMSTVKIIRAFMKLSRAEPASVNGVPTPPTVSH